MMSGFSGWADSLIRRENGSSGVAWADRGELCFLLLFGLTVPHSIAASQISLMLALICQMVRNVVEKRARPRRSPLDRPLLVFALLTIISSIFSYAPAISLAKLRGLGLFLIFYLISSTLTRRGGLVLLGCLVMSGLMGLGYSLVERVAGRGMTITVIKPGSPLAGSGLVAGDVIWMIGRQRVRSLEEAQRVFADHRPGERLEVEALHSGDPLPVALTVTEALQASPGGLGIAVSGPTRHFRISGLTRQFITYAEQMQMLGLLLLGLLLARLPVKWRLAGFIGFSLFETGLVLTATRSVIASFVGAMVLATARLGGRKVVITAIVGAILIGALGLVVVSTTRRVSLARFGDDSTMRRLGYMKAGLRTISRHPLLGVGMDAHKKFWREWGFPGDYITHTHSTPIQVAMDRGLPALAALIWLLQATWSMLLSGRRRAEDGGDAAAAAVCGGALACLAGFSLSALTNYNFGDSESLMMLLAIIGCSRSVMS